MSSRGLLQRLEACGPERHRPLSSTPHPAVLDLGDAGRWQSARTCPCARCGPAASEDPHGGRRGCDRRSGRDLRRARRADERRSKGHSRRRTIGGIGPPGPYPTSSSTAPARRKPWWGGSAASPSAGAAARACSCTTGCGVRGLMSIASISLPALGTTATLCVTDAAALGRARTVLTRELVEVDETCSRFRTDSELARLNRAAGRRVEVSERLLEAIEVALRAAAASDGLVDPTIGRCLRVAGYDRTFAAVRLRDGRSFQPRFAMALGWRQVELDTKRATVRVPVGCEIDLGATAKALAADRIARATASCAGGGVLVALGGDVAVAGDPPAGGWSIRLADDHTGPLDGPGPAVSIVSGGLASSSTMIRRWRAGRTELHHIIDPRTGRPASGPWRTVAVAARSCVDANVASTASIVLGEAAAEWLVRNRMPGRLVRASGSVVCVAGWPGDGE